MKFVVCAFRGLGFFLMLPPRVVPLAEEQFITSEESTVCIAQFDLFNILDDGKGFLLPHLSGRENKWNLYRGRFGV